MTARPARIKYTGTTVTGIVTQNSEYDVIAWLGPGGSGSGSVEAMFLDDSGGPRHFSIPATDWQVVRI